MDFYINLIFSDNKCFLFIFVWGRGVHPQGTMSPFFYSFFYSTHLWHQDSPLLSPRPMSPALKRAKRYEGGINGNRNHIIRAWYSCMGVVGVNQTRVKIKKEDILGKTWTTRRLLTFRSWIGLDLGSGVLGDMHLKSDLRKHKIFKNISPNFSAVVSESVMLVPAK